MPGWRNGRRGGLKNRWGETHVRVQFPSPVRCYVRDFRLGARRRFGGRVAENVAKGLRCRDVPGVKEVTAAQAAHSAGEAAVARFMASAKRRNPERFKRVCQAYPVLTRYGWRQIIAH